MGFQKMKLAGKIGVGVGRKLQLTKEQAAARMPSESLKDLKEPGGGIYEVMKPVEFKAGEVIGVEFAEVPKADYPALGVKGKAPNKPVGTKPEAVKEKKQAKKAEKPETPDAGEKTIIDPAA